MLFPTFDFVLFAAVVFPVYWAIPWRRPQLAWLLFASCFFYMSWNPWLISLILLSASVDYAAALALERCQSVRLKTALWVGSVTFNLGLLGVFKYFDFFLDSAGGVARWLGATPVIPRADFVLPLGISFYTFETVSYITDVYRSRSKAVRNPLDYALFILFFPHLVAGPIVRSRDFLPQLAADKRWSWLRSYVGVRGFLIGLVKKAVIADHLAAIADRIFESPHSHSSLSVFAGVLAYSGQIYCDFSGYSDMAIGLANLLGFKLPQNFRFPYLAVDIADFWRRWHISLSTWLRDYLYIPLGGNRLGPWRTNLNLLIVMLLGGLWHGAKWTFVLWGLIHGVALIVHRSVRAPESMRRPIWNWLWIPLTFAAVTLGWVFFRAETFGHASAILQKLLAWTPGDTLRAGHYATVAVSLALISSEHALFSRARHPLPERRLPAPAWGVSLAGLSLLALMAFPHSAKTFIYFQF